MINFCCPRCGRLTAIKRERQPVGRKKKCKGCNNIFILENFNRYEIIEEIGQGGMGKVYKAYDPELERIVALKIILPQKNIKENHIERFLREAKATAKLQHPNIVTVYDIGFQNELPFFTMDYIEGCSLKESIKKSSFTTAQISNIMIKIGNAVSCAHENGIIHRDLKPANIMMGKDELKVMDFGLAKIVDSDEKLSCSGAPIGTLRYMPPEQAEGMLEAIDERSDVYGLGAILYELLTQRAPIEGEGYANTLYLVLKQSPIPPTKIKPDIPTGLEKICLKALQKNKDQRHFSARELVQDLENFSKETHFLASEMQKNKKPLYSKRSKKQITMWLFGQKKRAVQNFLLLIGVISVVYYAVIGFGNTKNQKTNTPIQTISQTPKQILKDVSEKTSDLYKINNLKSWSGSNASSFGNKHINVWGTTFSTPNQNHNVLANFSFLLRANNNEPFSFKTYIYEWNKRPIKQLYASSIRSTLETGLKKNGTFFKFNFKSPLKLNHKKKYAFLLSTVEVPTTNTFADIGTSNKYSSGELIRLEHKIHQPPLKNISEVLNQDVKWFISKTDLAFDALFLKSLAVENLSRWDLKSHALVFGQQECNVWGQTFKLPHNSKSIISFSFYIKPGSFAQGNKPFSFNMYIYEWDKRPTKQVYESSIRTIQGLENYKGSGFFKCTEKLLLKLEPKKEYVFILSTIKTPEMGIAAAIASPPEETYSFGRLIRLEDPPLQKNLKNTFQITSPDTKWYINPENRSLAFEAIFIPK